VLLTLESDTRQALIASPVWFAILGVAYFLRRKRAS
jgi:D-serine/D-alanine/glycine transporter